MEKTVLIVDDDRVLIKTLGKILGDQGYRVLSASDGQEGIERLLESQIDLILLDVEMPVMNGYSFLFELRKLKQGLTVPVIILTCKDKMEDIFRVEGVREYIIKPVNNAELLEKIRKHL